MPGGSLNQIEFLRPVRNVQKNLNGPGGAAKHIKPSWPRSDVTCLGQNLSSTGNHSLITKRAAEINCGIADSSRAAVETGPQFRWHLRNACKGLVQSTD